MPEILPTAGDRTTRNCSIRHFLIALQKAKRHNAAGETVRWIIADNLSKGGWVLQLWIAKDERALLWTHTATESVSLRERMKH
jgi:hypothetical protein